MSIRVRFAPSPTGFLHVGGARTALFNWLIARKKDGAFVLRVEDTDRERSSEAMTRAIVDGLAWLGLEPDEGPFLQSDGLERHRADADALLSAGRVYRDFTTPEEAAADRERKSRGEVRRPERSRAEALGAEASRARAEAGEPHALRLRVPDGETTWEDVVKGRLYFDNAQMEDLVILRSDRTPTYNFAVVSDDAHMRITHVLRGDDHVSNTPKQILIYEALGHAVPLFGHLPMILGPDGKRLSKRHGATAVEAYRDQGILPQAMVNFLALLGWSPGDDTEYMTVDELIRRFSLERVLVKGSVFDVKKLEWLNGQHIQSMRVSELKPLLSDALVEGWDLDPQAAAISPEGYEQLIELLKVRGRTVNEMAKQAVPFLTEDLKYDDAAVKKHWKDRGAAAALLVELREGLAAVPWEPEELERSVRSLAEKRGVGAGRVIHPLRLALTGLGSSPGIFDVLVVLGRGRALQRLDSALKWLKNGDPGE